LDDGHQICQLIEVRILAVKRQAMTFCSSGDLEIVFRNRLPLGGESLLQIGIRGRSSVIGQKEHDLAREPLPLLNRTAAVTSALNAKAHFT
jgi:hypothetical protein